MCRPVFDWDPTYAQADLLDELEGVCAGHARRPQRPRAVLVVGAVAVSATKKRHGLLGLFLVHTMYHITLNGHAGQQLVATLEATIAH